MTTTVTPRELAGWLAEGSAVLVDVREPDEFKAEHIASAASMPLGSLSATLAVLPVPQDRKVVFQCLKGSRGEEARRLAERAGVAFATYNLDGGVAAWKAAGLPVVRTTAEGNAPSIFRQVQMAVGGLVFAAVVAGFSGWTPGFALAGFFGMMLAIAGFTGWCGLALVLRRMPWNRNA